VRGNCSKEETWNIQALRRFAILSSCLDQRIDVEKAKTLPGEGCFNRKGCTGRNGFGAILPDQPVIMVKGDTLGRVALIAAGAEEIAIEALKRSKWSMSPRCLPRSCLKPNAPRIHETGNLITAARTEGRNRKVSERRCWREPARSFLGACLYQ
jgi:hypothetical protein